MSTSSSRRNSVIRKRYRREQLNDDGASTAPSSYPLPAITARATGPAPRSTRLSVMVVLPAGLFSLPYSGCGDRRCDTRGRAHGRRNDPSVAPQAFVPVPIACIAGVLRETRSGGERFCLDPEILVVVADRAVRREAVAQAAVRDHAVEQLLRGARRRARRGAYLRRPGHAGRQAADAQRDHARTDPGRWRAAFHDAGEAGHALGNAQVRAAVFDVALRRGISRARRRRRAAWPASAVPAPMRRRNAARAGACRTAAAEVSPPADGGRRGSRVRAGAGVPATRRR